MKLKEKDYPRVRRTSQKAISLDTIILSSVILIAIILQNWCQITPKVLIWDVSACRGKFLSLLHVSDIFRSFSTLSSGTLSMFLAVFKNIKSNGQIQYCFLVFCLCNPEVQTVSVENDMLQLHVVITKLDQLSTNYLGSVSRDLVTCKRNLWPQSEWVWKALKWLQMGYERFATWQNFSVVFWEL